VGTYSSSICSSSIVRELNIKSLFGVVIGFYGYDFPIHNRLGKIVNLLWLESTTSVGHLVDRGFKHSITRPVQTVMVLNILIVKMGGHR
jgi:hypothetical protein